MNLKGCSYLPMRSKKQIPRSARDFACGLRRPQNGFSKKQIPRSARGFRLQAQTPAKRLNIKPAPILPRDFQRRL